MRASLLGTVLVAIVAIALLPGPVSAQGASSAYKADALKLAKWIDEYLEAQWKKHGVESTPLADDAIFFRRLSLDLGGKIPGVTQVQDFLDDKSPDKHWKWTDHYLSNELSSRHFANFWRTVIIGRSSNQQFQFFYPQFEAWLEDRLQKNTPLDEITKQIQTVQNNNVGMQPGGFGGGMQGNLSPIAFLGVNEGKPENIAGSAARVFLGVKIECAQCHKHPFAKWTRDQFWEFAAFFSGPNPFAQPMPPMKGAPKAPSFTPGREIVIPEVNKVVKAKFLNGKEPEWGAFSNSRDVLAKWMTSPENPYFARAMADHLWAYFFGVSLLEPILEPNDDSPVTHPDLLDRLAEELIAHKFDPKYLIRAIAMTKAYQRSSGGPELATKEDYHLFLRMPIRSLTPEQIYDSIAEATHLEQASGGYDPRFNINNPFAQQNTPRGQFLQRFGTQDRRYDPQTSILQALFMMNGKFMTERTKAEFNSDIATLAVQPGSNAKKLRTMFYLVLSRPPRADEVERLVPYLDKGGPTGNHQRAIEDVYWSLLNSPEFVLNH